MKRLNPRWMLLLCVFWPRPSPSMVSLEVASEDEMAQAPLVARIRIERTESLAHPDFHSQYEATAVVDAIERIKDDGGWFPRVGERLVINGVGGEVKEVGVMLSGYPRPRTGMSYRSYLKRSDSSRFAIAGFEKGLVPLSGSRSFTRNRTDGSNGEGDGAFLYWDDKYFPIPFYISAPTFKGLQTFAWAVEESFKTWRDPQDVKVEFISMGCTGATRNENDGVNSVILVTKDWPFDPNAIAITRNFYIAGSSPRAGLILDSDILLNGVNHTFTTTGETGKHDVQNIVTHEVGHFLGLGHEGGSPPNSDAVMYAVASPNEIKKRMLHANDLTGLRSAYSGTGQKMPFRLGPCVIGPGDLGCLAVHDRAGSAPSTTVLCALAALAGTLLLRRRRNRFVDTWRNPR